MKWLVTTPKGIDVGRLIERLSAFGCTADPDLAPIPLDDNEQVIEVDGPKDLPARASGESQILKVSPNSEMTLY